MSRSDLTVHGDLSALAGPGVTRPTSEPVSALLATTQGAESAPGSQPWTANGTRGARFCGTCRTTTTDPSPAGWFRVTVNEADSPRGYRTFGVFCTSECLAAKLPEVVQLLARIDRLTAELAETKPRTLAPEVASQDIDDTTSELFVLGEIVAQLERLPADASHRCVRYLADRFRAPLQPAAPV